MLSGSIFIIFFIFPCLSCPEYQNQTLLQFKSSLLAINSSLDTFDSWNSPSNSTSSTVIGLDLSDLNFMPYERPLLPSVILAPLYWIKSLKELDVSYNDILGKIPTMGIINLTKLVHLDMSGNKFNGSIPPQLLQLRHLQYLDLSSNSLRGDLSSEVGSLKNLKVLRLNKNFLNGKIPEEIGSLTKLQALSLHENILSDGIPSSRLELQCFIHRNSN